jgi:hypothetical protein
MNRGRRLLIVMLRGKRERISICRGLIKDIFGPEKIFWPLKDQKLSKNSDFSEVLGW